MIIYIFIHILILAIITVALQFLTESVIGKINEKIKNSMDDVKKKIEECNYTYKIEKEQEPFSLLETKREKLGFLTKIITYFEILIFSLLFVFLHFKYRTDFYEIIKTLSLVISGWVALKIFGNFQQWSGAVFGRATFYSFLIGTFLNIGSAILIGWLIVTLFSSAI